nr:hypothetical protein [uncultured Treponema sp.]
MKVNYFEKSHFYHLAGFQYLTDIANLHVNREKVYNNIKSGNIKPELLTSSVHYGEISEGIEENPVYLERFFRNLILGVRVACLRTSSISKQFFLYISLKI